MTRPRRRAQGASTGDLERLRGLARVGAARAATAFGEFVGSRIYAGETVVHDEKSSPLSEDWETGVFFEVDGELAGLVGIFLTPSSREEVAGQVLSPSAASSPRVVESALRELANIVASQTVSAIVDTPSHRIPLSVPLLVMADAEDTFASVITLRRGTDTALRIETELFAAEGAVRALLVFVPDPI